jgi:SAM-dependent methyltransferase
MIAEAAPFGRRPWQNPRMHDYDSTRRSWNIATRNHNTHKGDQAAFLRGGGDVLFPEELELLGDIRGARLVHLQCNAGQDSLCLARRGARVTGVDLSDEAIGFARRLSAESGIAAEFCQAEVVRWMHETEARFDVAFCSYGVTGWLPDLMAWARGVARILRPGGRLVYVEFHPIIWSFGKDLRLDKDDYFAAGPFTDPVGDYVAEFKAGLGCVVDGPIEENRVPAYSYQYGLAQVLDTLIEAGLSLSRVREYPYSNGCRLHPALVPGPEGTRRWCWPPGTARLPLMYGLSAGRGPDAQGAGAPDAPAAGLLMS